ncbi:MAG: hypothetical protein ACRELB_06450, partial [Polyangiaceae bacterium]
TGLPVRTLHHGHRHGLVPEIATVGEQFGYTELHLLQLRAAFQLKAQGVRLLADIAARLDAMDAPAMP